MSRHTRSAHRLALVAAPTPRPQAPINPATTLLDQITAGKLDPHLTAIAEAIRARFDLLQTVNSAKALGQLNLGEPWIPAT